MSKRLSRLDRLNVAWGLGWLVGSEIVGREYAKWIKSRPKSEREQYLKGLRTAWEDAAKIRATELRP